MSPASLGAIPCGLLLLTRELGAWTRLGLGLLPGPDSSHWACRAHVIGSPLLLTNTSWNKLWPCTVLSGARHARCCVALGKFSLLHWLSVPQFLLLCHQGLLGGNVCKRLLTAEAHHLAPRDDLLVIETQEPVLPWCVHVLLPGNLPLP